MWGVCAEETAQADVTVKDSVGYYSSITGSVVPTTDYTDGVWMNQQVLVGYGYQKSGSVTVDSGSAVTSGELRIGGRQVSGFDFGNGTVTITGTKSAWNATGLVYVGNVSPSSGTLNITAGGNLTNTGDCYIRHGVATVDGADSVWNNSQTLFVGFGGSYPGPGVLNITNGGVVSAANLTINGDSKIVMDIGQDSLLNVSGNVTNNGTVYAFAGAKVAQGDYTPIKAAGTWTSGSKAAYQALGGTWDSAHIFVVSAAQSVVSGTPVTLDRASGERALVKSGNWGVGASFVAATSGTMNFTATAITGAALDPLTALVKASTGDRNAVLGAWDFATTGYTVSSTTPAYLSMDVGAGRTLDELKLWHHDGSGWTSYTASDLTYDGQYANFTVKSFSGYAVSGVPEPGTVVLLSTGLVVALAYGWRRRKR
jgi:T5SS/PEP-CTERM-associated repeat protein